MDRRSFVKSLAVLGAAAKLGAGRVTTQETDITAARIPRWRGFNLQGRFAMAGKPSPGRAFDEFDFAAMAEWEFDFARLPLEGSIATARRSAGPRTGRRSGGCSSRD